MKRLALAATACTLALLPGSARADPPAPSPLVLALIVTNNHSAELGRPELQYADDDGAKYYEVFRMVSSGAADVELLTDFDRDSARLFPEPRAAAHEPTRAGVAAAVDRLAARSRQAAQAGRAVEFYFVFAGHGDVDRGRGFLEVKDGRLTSDDIEAMLRAIPSARAHVILDSCNSFFVLNPRRPGGRQLAVTEEAARSLSDRLPNVGVLLSTSAEAEVFEWSELQSGIFSHAVRSGLLGGADADGDGRVTYDEIRGFVDVVSTRIDNPLYRPKVFARGPNGRGDEPIFDLHSAQALRLELDAREQRVTVRDVQELAWIDVHKEAGARATLRMPLRRATGASVDERDPLAPGAPVVARHPVGTHDDAAPVAVASLETRPPEARGPNELLAKLFAAPFGPRAFADWREQSSHEAAPVYGISTEDAERMRLLLFETADMQRLGRHAGGALLLTTGALFMTGGAWMLLDHQLPLADPKALGYTLFGEGAAMAIGGGVILALRGDGERLYGDYVRALANPPVDGARVVADTEKRFFDLSDRTRLARHVLQPVGWGLVGLAAADFVFEEATDRNATRRLELGVVDGCVGFAGLATAILSSVPSPIERLGDLWANDPAIQRLPRAVEPPHLSVAPLRGGGALIGVGGAF
jgi:hypothetical protein